MRLYTFTNFYLSSIQQGIQTAHVVSELFVDYSDDVDKLNIVNDWAKNHKTIICLNGGNNKNLNDLYDFFSNYHLNPYPWTSFFEDKDSLGNVMTCVGIILPEKFWVEEEEFYSNDYTSFEERLYYMIKNKGLAR